MNKRRSGFTLVELLVVISIMSILTIVGVAQFTTARKRGQDTQRKGDISALSRALLAYYADQGAFPPNIDFTSSVGLTSPSGDYIYMKVLPKENHYVAGSQPQYCYVVDNILNPQKFGIFAQLEVTTDPDCVSKASPYIHCGGDRFCYASVSPNIKATDLAGTLP